jgi:TolB protein
MIAAAPARSLLFAVLTLALGLIAAPASAIISIDINRGNVNPLPIAIPEFIPVANALTDVGTVEELGRNVATVIEADLERSGLFAPIPHAAFISLPNSADIRPRFSNWRAIGAQALVIGQVIPEADGRLRFEFRLWDVLSETYMIGNRYIVLPLTWRRVAHLIADDIYERLTGESGYFDTRIVYVSETGPKSNRVKRLAIMDQDGANNRFLSDGKYLVLTPRFSPTTQEITYHSFFNDKPRVYLYNIDTGRHEVLGDFPNMTFAPRFSPDGNAVVMSLAENGNSDIYVMDLRTRQVKRLTDHPGIDTSPSYSPDGKFIVFNSNRGGSQQLYVMRTDGSDVKRISFGSGRYGTPVWSPRGDLIAFTKIDEAKFRIGVMRPDGTGERLLTDSYQDEGPTWAPNGRVIMFFRQNPYTPDGRGGETSLWSVDLTGYNERRIPTPFDASDPAWSPLLK